LEAQKFSFGHLTKKLQEMMSMPNYYAKNSINLKDFLEESKL